MNYQTQLKQYQKAHVSSIDDASPHELITQLLIGAKDRITSAKGAIERKEHNIAGENIGKAISIVEYLNSILDHKKGGEVCERLASLYDYMARRLLYANLHKDVSVLEEISHLLEELRAGWEGIDHAS